MSDYKAIKHKGVNALIIAFSLVSLIACGGGATGNKGETVASGEGGIIGTARILASTPTKVYFKSQSGKRAEADIDPFGKFRLSKTDADAYLLRVKKVLNNQNSSARKGVDSSSRSLAQFAQKEASDDYYYSVAHSDGKHLINRNIHPYTDLIVRNWFATKMININKEFDSNQPIMQIPSVAEINAIENEIKGIVARVLADYGVNQSVDLLSTPYDRNGKGLDSFLDKNKVVIDSQDKITIILKQPSGNAITISVKKLSLNKDLTSNNDAPPSTPENLMAYPQSATSIILRWKASTDDKGVSGYNIYRNNHKIATTAYPVYTDTGLTSGQNYRYQVEALDGRNQTSAKTAQTAPVSPSSNATIPLNGSYDVVVTSTSTEAYCSGATGSFVLSNDEDINGSVTSDTNSSYVFTLNGKRNKNTGEVTGGFAITQGITYASINGIINGLDSNGTYSDIRGCKGVWVATKQ